jgi:hypothetical protein
MPEGTMMNGVAVLLGRSFSPRAAGGASRLAALLFFLLAVAGAATILLEPQFAR